jgi:DNA-binding CsgD family transcriptional regulator
MADPINFAATSGTHDTGSPQAEPLHRSTPGIMVFNTSMAVVFRNEEARLINDQLSAWEVHHPANGILPPCVMALAERLLDALRLQSDVKSWEQTRITQVVGDAQAPILIRGFGLPPGRGLPMSHVLILMEKVGRRTLATPAFIRDRFGITDREAEILDCLAKGQTNKEIASSLTISEQTVKEHLKNLLRKTKSTTRTGLISQILISDALPFSDGAPDGRFATPRSDPAAGPAERTPTPRSNGGMRLRNPKDMETVSPVR